jgi:hypothetical protein
MTSRMLEVLQDRAITDGQYAIAMCLMEVAQAIKEGAEAKSIGKCPSTQQRR